MDESGVACGEMGGKRDWKIDVVKDSRCLGMLLVDSEEEAERVDVKLFMTS